MPPDQSSPQATSPAAGPACRPACDSHICRSRPCMPASARCSMPSASCTQRAACAARRAVHRTGIALRRVRPESTDPRNGARVPAAMRRAGQWRDVACAGLRGCLRRGAGASECFADSRPCWRWRSPARPSVGQRADRGHRDGLRPRLPARAVTAPAAGGWRLVSTAHPRLPSARSRAPRICCGCHRSRLLDRLVAAAAAEQLLPARSSTTRTR